MATGFSAIARSVMISAYIVVVRLRDCGLCFSAIARSVMISAGILNSEKGIAFEFQCYSS